ncbi:MAG: hypothetical protein KAJ95_02800 [Gammaproteobacteria bacterium]|nr:hypothetical protein [Gammaproteobacteria bacterium]
MKPCMHDIQVSNLNENSDDSNAILSFSESLQKMALENNVVLIEDDDTSLAAFMVGFIVERVITQCNWHASRLTSQQQRAVWFVMLALSERICKILETTPKLVTTYAAIWVFRHDKGYLFGSMLNEMNSKYIGLSACIESRLQSELLTRSIDRWVHNSDFLDNRQITRIAIMLAGQTPHREE